MLTSIDIRNQVFDLKMRGYDRDQVDRVMKEAADTVEELTKKNKDIQEELDWALKRLDNYEEMQESLNKSILVAQEAADQLKDNSTREADMILTDAKKQADLMIKEAISEVKKIDQDANELRKQSRSFKQRLQIMVESQLELIESQNWDDVLKEPSEELVDYSSYAETFTKDVPSAKDLREEIEASLEGQIIENEEDTNKLDDSGDSNDHSYEYVSDPHSEFSQIKLGDETEDGPVIDLPE